VLILTDYEQQLSQIKAEESLLVKFEHWLKNWILFSYKINRKKTIRVCNSHIHFGVYGFLKTSANVEIEKQIQRMHFIYIHQGMGSPFTSMLVRRTNKGLQSYDSNLNLYCQLSMSSPGEIIM